MRFRLHDVGWNALTAGDVTKRFQACLAAAGEQIEVSRFEARRSIAAPVAGCPSPRRDADARTQHHRIDDEHIFTRLWRSRQCPLPDQPPWSSNWSSTGGLAGSGRFLDPTCRTRIEHEISLVPEVGVEPTRACAHRCLRPTRLPIP